MLQLKSLALASLIAAVSAHQNLHQFWVNDDTPGFEVGIRKAPSNSPVTDLTSNDIVCNVGGTSGAGVKTIEAKAGDKITVQWDQSSHPGPITHFLHGPVASAEAATGLGEWFKIDELDSEGGKWGNEIMGANQMKHTFTIPAGVATGEYLLRSEMLGLHASQTLGGGQFYIGCMQLKITGTSSSASCGPKITLPGAYKEEDANIYISNFYNGYDLTTYKAPGGPVASCGAGSSNPSPEPTSTPRPTSVAPTPIETSATAPSSTEVPTPTETPAETPVPTPSEPEVSSPTKPAEGETPAATSIPTPSEPEPTPTPSPATSLPANTKLSSVLSWLSKFYAANKDDFDGSTALRRRHARQFNSSLCVDEEE